MYMKYEMSLSVNQLVSIKSNAAGTFGYTRYAYSSKLAATVLC